MKTNIEFSIGDPFIYFSKFAKGSYSLGVVEDIREITMIIGNIKVKKFIINKIYDHNEIFHYEVIKR